MAVRVGLPSPSSYKEVQQVSYLPDISRSQGIVLSRKEQKALVHQMGATGLELLTIDHTVLLERTRVRGLGAIAGDAIEESSRLADDVVANAQRNPLAGQLGAELALAANRAMKERIDLANRRLG
jgi:hypothetical protein